MKRIFTLAAVFAVSGTMAFSAPVTVESIVTDLQSQGYTRIEIKEGPTQIKVEAIKGTTKIETVYDIATGTVLKTETKTVGLLTNTTPGVKVKTDGKDFVKNSSSNDDDDDDMDDDSDDDSDDNDDDDDNGSSGSGSNDSDDDDDNGSSGGNDNDDDD